MRSLIISLLMTTLLACSGSKNNQVWRNYDFLNSVPTESGLTVSQSPRSSMRLPYDNDFDYIPPEGFGLCTNQETIYGCE